jgi:putative endonuclease
MPQWSSAQQLTRSDRPDRDKWEISADPENWRMTRLRTAAQQLGDDGERLVAGHLEQSGWRILGRNVHLGRAEIDLLAIDPGPPATLVLVEVRWRRQRAYGLPEETVTWRKRAHLRAALGRLIEAGRLPDGTPLPTLPFRIDIVALEPDEGGGTRIRHHRAAI